MIFAETQSPAGCDTLDPPDCVDLYQLATGTRLEMDTVHNHYLIENLGSGRLLISGHPGYCPEPTEVTVRGANFGRSGTRSCCLGPGRRLEFWHPSQQLVMTSRILQVRQAG